MNNYSFTSESVTNGHPDKICDIIADKILDTALMQDVESKMAVEATIKDDLILIYGEAKTKAKINYEKIALDMLKEIGYNEKYYVLTKISKQSPEINKTVVKENGEIGAGDQGIMFGYACNDTDALMPMPIHLAHQLAKRLEIVIKKHDYLRPDGKTQVTIEYENDKPKYCSNIVVSVQHSSDVELSTIKDIISNEVIFKVIPTNMMNEKTVLNINPSGSFVKGGSFGDSGTTGRKIVCDTYGGMGRIGGGCLSSKDPSKVDRSAAYYCRYVAKNIVANKLADKCEIQVSYIIGMLDSQSLYINTFGTGKYSDERLLEIIRTNFNFKVSNILKELNLKSPIYSQTSCYGHFGKSELPWEKTIELKY